MVTKSSGSLALLLHAHLPFVRHPEHEEFHEEDWLFEAVAETYIPLLRIFRRLAYDRAPVRLALTMTPTLCAMLRDPLLQQRTERYLDRGVELSRREIERTAGDAHLTVDVEGVRCSFFVCYDLRFAEEFWGLAPDTDCYVVVANWPAPRRDHWRALLKARAIENQAYVVGVNRVGHGGRLDYAGDSAVVQPFGETHEADGPTEQTLVRDVDPAVVAETRARYPFLTDRR